MYGHGHHFGIINHIPWAKKEEYATRLPVLEQFRQSLDRPRSNVTFVDHEPAFLPAGATQFTSDYPELVTCNALSARISTRMCRARQDLALSSWQHYLRYRETSDLGDLSDKKLGALMTCSNCVNRQSESELPSYGNLIQILWMEFEALVKYLSEFDFDGKAFDVTQQRLNRRAAEKRFRERRKAEAVEAYQEILGEEGAANGPESLV